MAYVIRRTQYVFSIILLIVAAASGSIIRVPTDIPTIMGAVNAAADGDTILIEPGTYSGSITISNKSVFLASLFLITGNKDYIDQTILDGNNGNQVIRITSSAGSATTIWGLQIRNGDDGIFPNAKFNILHCKITDCADGIDYESGSGGICKFNIFENNSDDAIDLDDDVDIIIEENIIRNNNDDGIEIRLQPYTASWLNCIIRRNEIYGNGEDGIQFIDYNGLSNRFFLIERNLIYNNAMVGIGCMGNQNTNENYEGASILERIYVLNNTFAGNNYGITGGDSLVALNNIFVNHPGTAMKNVDNQSIVSFSIYYNNGVNFDNCNLDSPNLLFGDPLLDADFKLQPESPAIDAGAAAYNWNGYTVLNLSPGDYFGAAPDMGAFESGEDDPLPVTLSLFSAEAGNNQVTLRWVTESELNNDAFIIDRSLDGIRFHKIAEIPGKGNSNVRNEYHYIDSGVVNRTIYFYRLADRDFNGKITYHGIISARPQPPDHLPGRFVLHLNYPNPFNPETNIKFVVPNISPGGEKIDLSIYDVFGKKVITLARGAHTPGEYRVKWYGKDESGRAMPSGIYYYRLSSRNYSETQKLVLLK